VETRRKQAQIKIEKREPAEQWNALSRKPAQRPFSDIISGRERESACREEGARESMQQRKNEQ
jgi:hypothetical protein